jgi:Amt family ammonium transporter
VLLFFGAVGDVLVLSRSRTWSGTSTGLISFTKGAIDFAGGTVVHINAGVAALVGLPDDRQAGRLRQAKTWLRIRW